MPKPITQNTLFYGDNLPILREHIPDESIDLVYLDPPFNSNRSYNVLFREESGAEAEAQITAFDDTWHWNASAERTFHELIQNAPAHVVTMLGALREFVGANQMMAYLTMMAARLVELRRVLKPTGSLYLHCDPTASHYLKVVMDTIFGVENFRNEVVWKRTTAHSSAKKYAPIHDTLLYYSKTQMCTWNEVRVEYTEEYLDKYYKYDDGDGRLYWRADLCAAGIRHGRSGVPWRGIDPAAKGMHWKFTVETLDKLDAEGRIYWPKDGIMPMYKRYREELKGKALPDIWDDVNRINPVGSERLGYPTQKPLALLERIIQASSNEGDWVLDPFCGCGTAVAAAHKLNRKWIGIDITLLSISLMKYRLKDMFGLVEKKDYTVIGEPEDLDSAHQLARSDRYQFQWWALSLVQAKPLGGADPHPGLPPKRGKGKTIEGRKGSDRGIDGVLNFMDEKGKLQRVLIQVKSGHVKSGDIRDLRGAVEREETAIGVFVTLETPTQDMVTEAVSAGYFQSKTWQKDYPRIQILTVEDLLTGKGIDMPPSAYGTFKQAEKVKKQEGKQGELGI